MKNNKNLDLHGINTCLSNKINRKICKEVTFDQNRPKITFLDKEEEGFFFRKKEREERSVGVFLSLFLLNITL